MQLTRFSFATSLGDSLLVESIPFYLSCLERNTRPWREVGLTQSCTSPFGCFFGLVGKTNTDETHSDRLSV